MRVQTLRGRRPLHPEAEDSMRKQVILINIILVAFHFLTESHSVLSTFSKEMGDRTYDWFLSPSYQRDLPLKWYLKMNFDSLLTLVVIFLWHRTAQYQSRRLFFTLAVWVLYHMADLSLFWWNYKSNWPTYWSMLAVAVVLTIVILMPIKEKAKVVDMN